MGRRRSLFALCAIPLLAAAGGAAVATASQAPAHPLPDWARNLPPPFLSPGYLDATEIVPPAPVTGDPRYRTDREIFRATRKLQGTPRWNLAVRDVEMAPAAMMRNFSCAANRELTPDKAPKLERLMLRVLVDGEMTNGPVKKHYQRLRPFQIDKGPTCQPAEEVLGSYDYPSGHTVWGWGWAYVLSELLPARASQIMQRGRAYGESRVICGVHNYSAVQAGSQVAAATFVTLNGNEAFRSELAAVQAEVNALPELDASARQACRADADLLGQSIYADVRRH